jgi:ATP adenylyltransferase
MDHSTPGSGHAPAQPRPFGPDAVWAPWRLPYLESIADEAAPAAHPTHAPDMPAGASSGTFLSDYWANPHLDEHNHVVARTHAGMILLNAYPYANGHLLVALGEGRPRLTDYTPAQRSELWALVDTAAALVERALEPQGINIGINQGRAAGAGVPQHLHVHLVPRWGGDTNFITVVGGVRVIPSALSAMHRRYATAWAAMQQGR